MQSTLSSLPELLDLNNVDGKLKLLDSFQLYQNVFYLVYVFHHLSQFQGIHCLHIVNFNFWSPLNDS